MAKQGEIGYVPSQMDEVKVQDDLGQQIIDEQISSLVREIKLFSKEKEDTQKSLDNYKTQWNVQKRLYEIMLDGDNIESVTPKIKYEKIPEFWELQKQMLGFKIRQDTHLNESKIKGYEQALKVHTEGLDSALSKYKDLTGKDYDDGNHQ